MDNVERLAQNRQRYRDDPEYRERLLAKQRRSYARNSEAKKAYNNARNAELQEARMEIVNERRAAGCVDCGWCEEPGILQFDHVRGKRLFIPSSGGGRSVSALLVELDKCEVRCPNCHALRHFRERRIKCHGLNVNAEPSS